MTTRCPASAELLRHALGRPDDPAAAAVSRHVSGCASCQAEIGRLREAAAALRHAAPAASPTDGCLDDFAIAALADGELAESEHVNAVAHLAGCARCRERIASVSRILRDPTVAAARQSIEASGPARRDQPRWTSGRRRLAGVSVAAGLAAAAVMLVVLRPDDPTRTTIAGRPGGPVHRDQATLAASGAPRLISPTGAEAGDTLRWTSVPHADRYRVVVFDRQGNTVFEAQTTDTAIALPESPRVARSQVLLWKVAARTNWDRWVESELVELERAPSRPRVP